jgi:drug/metabolite transporter (DMT)-like permease
MSAQNSTVAASLHRSSSPGQSQRTAGAGFALSLLAAASFSTAGSFARSLAEAGWSPSAAVAARASIAAVLLAIPAAFALRGRWSALRRNAAMIAVYGVIPIAGCQLFYFQAVQHLSVGVALLLEYLGIILVVGWMWLRHGHRPRRLTVAGSAVALLGLVFVIDVLGESRLDVIGVLWALAAAFGLATYFVLSSKVDDNLPPAALASGGMIVGALTLFGLAGIGALPMHATFGTVDFAGHRASWLVPVGGLSLVAAAIAYLAGIGAARRLGPTLASFVGLTEVIFAVLVAWALLGELPTTAQLGGGVLIVVGIALVRIDELRPRAPRIVPARPRVDQPPRTSLDALADVAGKP